MNHQQISEALRGAAVRFERCVFLAGALADFESLPDDLSGFLEDCSTEDIQEVINGFPTELLEDADVANELAAEWLIANGRLGFLVNVATPVMERITKSARSYSWGYYRTKWLYGETMASVVQQALAWATTCRDAEDAKAKGGA